MLWGGIVVLLLDKTITSNFKTQSQ